MTPTVNQSTRLRLGYGLAALLILVAEVLIALFVRDRFIRPYGGDILVTLLICCAIRVILPRGYRLPIGGGCCSSPSWWRSGSISGWSISWVWGILSFSVF